MRVVETFFSRPKTRFILQFYDVRKDATSHVICKAHRIALTIVSGYSTVIIPIRSISSFEKRPNWISLMVRNFALECAKLRFAMIENVRDDYLRLWYGS